MIFSEVVDILIDLLGPKITGDEAERVAEEVLQYITNQLLELLEG